MERDVVLAHEVIARGGRIVPPCAPCLRVALAAGPFDGCGQVADHGVEPHVQLFVRVVDPALDRHRDAPVDVTRDGARLDFLEQADGEVDDVGAPAFAGLEPREIGFGERRQVEEEVLGLLEARGFAVDLGYRVDQLVRVEFVAAGVALVATGAVCAADRAGALDVAVRQGAAGGRGDGDLLRALVDVAVLQALREQLLHDLLVVAGGGAREQVVAQTQIAQILGDHAVVAVGKLLRAHAFLVGFHQDRGGVLVGTRDHQHVIALHTFVSCVHVGRNAEAGDMTDVTRAVRVRPCNIHQNMTHGDRLYKAPYPTFSAHSDRRKHPVRAVARICGYVGKDCGRYRHHRLAVHICCIMQQFLSTFPLFHPKRRNGTFESATVPTWIHHHPYWAAPTCPGHSA